MSRFLAIPIIVLGLMAVSPMVAAAAPCVECGVAHHCAGCGATACGHDCDVQYVEKTVMVPTWETEMRRVMCTEYQTEPRERKRMVCKQVPVQVEKCRTVVDRVPEVCTRTVNYTEVVRHVETVDKTYTVCLPVHHEVEKPVTVMVPYQVEHSATRMVCKPYKETVMHKVTKDYGAWETYMVEVPVCHCRTFRRGGCGVSHCGETKMVERRRWVPNLVTEEVPRDVVRTKWVEEEYTYTTVECRQETRMQKCIETEYVTEERTKRMNVVRFVPECRTKEVQFTKYHLVPRQEKYMATVYQPEWHEVVEMVNVCVPVQVEKEVPVRVCKYVPKTVTVAVHPCCGRRCWCGR